MSREYTPRLKLISESDDEIVDSFPYNWPLLDSAVGATVIADGATPANNAVYHGQIFRETTTGKSWMAKVDPLTGSYTKSWLTYPWQCQAVLTGHVMGTSTTHVEHVFNNGLVAAQCINAGAESLNASKRIVVPIDGIYTIDILARWFNNSTGFRAVAIAHDGSGDVGRTEVAHHAGDLEVCWASDCMKLVANTQISMTMWQNSGGNLQVDVWGTVQMVSPL